MLDKLTDNFGNNKRALEINSKISSIEAEKIPGKITCFKNRFQINNQKIQVNSLNTNLFQLINKISNDHFSTINFIDPNIQGTNDIIMKKLQDIYTVQNCIPNNLESQKNQFSKLIIPPIIESINSIDLSLNNLSNLASKKAQKISVENILSLSSSKPLYLNNTIHQGHSISGLKINNNSKVESLHMAKLILPTFNIDVNNYKSSKAKSIDSINHKIIYHEDFDEHEVKPVSEHNNVLFSRKFLARKNRRLLLPVKKIDILSESRREISKNGYENLYKKLLLDCSCSPFKYFVRINNSNDTTKDNPQGNHLEYYIGSVKSDRQININDQRVREISTRTENSKDFPYLPSEKLKTVSSIIDYKLNKSNINLHYSQGRLRTGNSGKNSFIIRSKVNNNYSVILQKIQKDEKSKEPEIKISENKDSSSSNVIKKLEPILEERIDTKLNSNSNHSLLVDKVNCPEK